MVQNIFIIDEDKELYEIVERLFESDSKFKIMQVKTKKIEVALKNIPSLIIINEDTIKEETISIIGRIKTNDDNLITPIIVISSNIEKEHRVKILKECVEYYIKKPIDEQYLYYTIKNLIRLLSINRTVSPLTGLPGNVQIQAEMRRRLLSKEFFAMLYIDLDNFKAYNDVYGFLKGDEIIKWTANVIQKHVHVADEEGGFVGHIGGDDFIAIISNDKFEELCQNIILEFQTTINMFFKTKDVKKGYLESENRKGDIDQFPLTTISIGVVGVRPGKFKSVIEISEVGTQVKHQAKTILGNSYVIDRRKR